MDKKYYTNMQLSTCSSLSCLPMFKYKKRQDIHESGIFHIGIQAYIIQKDHNGEIKILINERSNFVDISKGKYDQIAIQMIKEDKESIQLTLTRGLKEEIGISINDYVVISPPDIEIKVVKKYEEKKTLYNREYVKLFFIFISSDVAKRIDSSNIKISNLFWLNYKVYKKMIKENPEKFTKTAQMYVLNPELLKMSDDIIKNYYGNAVVKIPNKLLKTEFYQLHNGFSIIINHYKKDIFKKILFINKGQIIKEFKKIIIIKTDDFHQNDFLFIYLITTKNKLFIYEKEKLIKIVKANINISINYIKLVKKRIRNYLKKADEYKKKNYFKILNNIHYQYFIDHYLSIEENIDKLFIYNKLQLFYTINDKNNLPIDVFILIGTFDPLHFGHLRVLIDSMLYILELRYEQRKMHGIILPIGDYAKSPDGQIWKNGIKRAFSRRYKNCQQGVKYLNKFISVSSISKKFSNSYGIELCFLLLKTMFKHNSINLYITCGADTWNTWQDNFNCIYNKYRSYDYIKKTLNKIFFVVQETYTEKVYINKHNENLNIIKTQPQINTFIRGTQIRELNLKYYLT